MQYLIVVSGRSFAIGGTMPISITFMPWTKMKVHRVSVLIEGALLRSSGLPSRIADPL